MGPWGAGTLLGGRYELTERVGTGGVAEVWRAVDTRLHRQVAVKLLAGPAARDPVQRGRIEREARALAALTHPGILSIYDYDEEPGDGGAPVPYIVMEFVDGPDLARRLAEAGPLPVADAVSLMARVLEGVGAAHGAGIVHGDLKPGNILLADGPAGWNPKVADFGVARVLAEETGTTAPVATPAYAPPEVLRGERPGPASDVYSAACIVFETLTGRRPFDGRTVWEATRQHLEMAPPSLRTLRPDAPDALEHELERALSKNAADRHPSAEAFADALAATVEIPPDDLEATAPQPHGTADVPVLIQETGEHKNFQPELDPTVLVPRPPTELLPPRPRTRVAWMQPATWKRLGTRPGPLIALLAILVLLVMRGQAGAIVRVPALTGRSLAGATELARQSGFGVRPTEVAGGGKPGTVVGQDPAPGRLLARGSSIELRVTRGARQVVVPDVSGKPIEEAIRALGEAKLSAGADVSYVTSQTVKPGNVVRTVPPAGAGVDEGSTVQIIASALPLPADEDGSGKGHGKGKGRD